MKEFSDISKQILGLQLELRDNRSIILQIHKLNRTLKGRIKMLKDARFKVVMESIKRE